MLVFIINTDLAPSVMSPALRSLCPQSYEIVPVSRQVARTINSRLAQYPEPYYLTLRHEDSFSAEFLTELLQAAERLRSNELGIRVSIGEDQYWPILWRTAPMSAHQYAEYVPFDHYVIQERMYQMESEGYQWQTLNHYGYQAARKQPPAWMRREQEQLLVQPIIRQFSSPLPLILTPSITVILCTYNNADYIPWAIFSVMKQTQNHYQLIIIDDGSTDDTAERVEPFLADKRIKYVHNAVNQGKAACLNQALSHIQTEWFLELDADDWLPCSALSAILRQTNQTSDDTAMLYGNYYEWLERPYNQLLYRGSRTFSTEQDIEHLVHWGCPLAPRIYRTSMMMACGGWDLDTPGNGQLYEDFEMIMKLSSHYRLLHVPDFLYHRRLRSSSITHRNAEQFTQWKTQWNIPGGPAPRFKQSPQEPLS